MSLTSQLITDVFPDLDKVEKLNKEAFPEEERVPLSEFLRYQDREDAHFFAFYNQEEFVGFAFAISNPKAFYISFCHHAPLEKPRIWKRNHRKADRFLPANHVTRSRAIG